MITVNDDSLDILSIKTTAIANRICLEMKNVERNYPDTCLIMKMFDE